MFRKLLSIFKKKTVLDFYGGIYLHDMKKIQSNRTQLRQIPLPNRFIIPLKQHFGMEGNLCVKKGDCVLRGQPLTVGCDFMLPVHAPTSGKIIDTTLHSIIYPSSPAIPCVIVETDGEDRWIKRDGWKDYYTHTRESLIERIYQYSVVGLGGAGFPTGIKLRSKKDTIETLIINAAECEPYITADDRLIQEYSAQIIEGIRILAYILNPRKIIISIEKNRPQAISALQSILEDNNDIDLRILPNKYPSGGEKQLTQLLTGKQIPSGGHAIDIGILVQNVSTIYAIKRAVIDGEPLTERVVTVTGEAISQPANVWVRLGTSVGYLLEQMGLFFTSNQIVIMGGPFMGFILPRLDIPVIKMTNCLLVPSIDELSEPKEERSCIRCGACSNACPMNLLPQQLYWFSQAEKHDKAQIYNIFDCIECGICSWVCPSNIPLVKYFRREKAEIQDSCMRRRRSTSAKDRFEARQSRLKRNRIFIKNIK